MAEIEELEAMVAMTMRLEAKGTDDDGNEVARERRPRK